MDKKSLKFVIFFLIVLFISQCIDQFWVIELSATPSLMSIKSIVINILSTIACACGVSAVWEIFCKKSFTQEVLILNKMSESCYEGGVEYIYKDYNDVDWSYELTNVKKFTIFFCYGYTWRNHNRAVLRDFINKGGEIRVIMPDYTCNNLMLELDTRFGYGCASGNEKKMPTSDRIREAYLDFKQMGAIVQFHRRTLCALYFLMDGKALYVPFRHCEKHITYPAIRLSNRGCMYKFIKEDIENLAVYDTPKNELSAISEK